MGDEGPDRRMQENKYVDWVTEWRWLCSCEFIGWQNRKDLPVVDREMSNKNERMDINLRLARYDLLSESAYVLI